MRMSRITILKIDGGLVDILDNEEALEAWAISGPYIACMIKEDRQYDFGKPLPHHEANDTFERRFMKHRNLLKNAFEKFGNTFEMQQENLLQIVRLIQYVAH